MDELSLTRRHFCSLTLTGIAAPSSLLEAQTALPHRAPKAKRVIYLFQQGAPSQLDLFDHKPAFAKFRGTGLPDSIRQGRRLTGMTAYQTALSLFKLAQDGQTLADRAWGSGFLPTPSEPASIFDIYGSDACTPGAYAANCILARRLSERGVPFIQLFHRGWYQHGNLTREIRKTDQTDHPTAALIEDLRQRGLLDDTLVVWGGEFGRTVYSQGTPPEDN